MSPVEFQFVQDANVDADHPHGDLDRIDCDVELLPDRNGNELFGHDVAFLYEAVAERYLATDPDGSDHAIFDLVLRANGHGRETDRVTLRAIYDHLRDMMCSTGSDTCWFTSKWDTTEFPKLIDGSDSIEGCFVNVLREGSPLVPDISDQDWNSLKLRRLFLATLFFSNLATFGTYFSFPLARCWLLARKEDFDISGSGFDIEQDLDGDVLYVRRFFERKYDSSQPDEVSIMTATVGTRAGWKPGADNVYWDRSTSVVMAFIFIHVYEEKTGSDGRPIMSETRTYNVAGPIGSYDLSRLDRIPTFLQYSVAHGQYLRTAGITLWESGSAPDPSQGGSTSARQTIVMKLAKAIPLLKIRKRTRLGE